MWCDIPPLFSQGCATVGTRVTCLAVALCSLPACSGPVPSSLPVVGVPLPVPPSPTPSPCLLLAGSQLPAVAAGNACPQCRPPRRGLLRGLQVQGDGGWGLVPVPPRALNSIFSTLRSSEGSRRQLLLRETSGFAVVANALIPVPWKTLLRPALRFRKGKKNIGRREKQGREECGSVRL